MKDNEKTQAQVGALVGATQTKVSDWIQGRRISLANAIAVRDAIGIPVEAWTQPVEEKRRKAS